MALWLVRAGSGGEYETKFISESRVYVTWTGLKHDLRSPKGQPELRQVLADYYPDNKPKTIMNNASQLWPFAHSMNVGDWVVLPRKTAPVVCIGEIVGDYEFHRAGSDPFFHSRKVKWLATDVPRANFSQDLLYSFGAFMTICRIARNDAEARVRAMAKNHWKPETNTDVIASHGVSLEGEADLDSDLAVIATDQLARLIKAKFKGHGLARLVGAILQAQGFEIHLSPPGPDGGVDILAAAGSLGFGELRIAVQVKSEDGAIDLAALKHLKGTMSDVKANRGMLVAWGGFKSSVEKERATSFFDVRLWNQNDIIEALLENYEKLDPEIRAELPLKQIWTVASQVE